MAIDGKPIEPPSGSGWGTKLVGILLMAVAILVAVATWWLLPQGHYPFLIVAIPAFPFVWLAWLCFKKVGWGTHAPEIDPTHINQPEAAIEAHEKRMPNWQLWLIGFAVLVIACFLAAYFFS